MSKKVSVYPSLIIERVENCPTDSGVYVMKGSREEVLYVGKAKNLRKRVQSYFRPQLSDDRANIKILLPKVRDLEFFVTENEVEALILESSFIKRWRPPYNIRLRDDKTYPYLRLDRNHTFPRVYYARRPQKVEKNQYFGPFPSSYALRVVMDSASKVFQLRDCQDREFRNRSRPCLSHQVGRCTAPCVGLVGAEEYETQLEAFLEFLSGNNEKLLEQWACEMEEASEKLDFERAARLRDRIDSFKRIREEQQQNVLGVSGAASKDIWASYPHLSHRADGESLDILVMQIREGQWTGKAHFPVEEENTVIEEDTFFSLFTQYYLKNDIPHEVVVSDAINAEKWIVLKRLFEKIIEEKKEVDFEFRPQLRKVSEENSFLKLWELVEGNVRLLHVENERIRQGKKDALRETKRILRLPELPRRIECLDVSNIQGTANVASCVVFINGKKESSEYRKFKIKSFEGQNDFASMKEVIHRRYLKEDAVTPDLLVIDGGKGQLSVVEKVLEEAGIQFPVVALAKARTKKALKGRENTRTEERLFLPGQKNAIPLKHQGALRLFTELRDEAHRFAIEFHRKKRSEKMFE